MQNGQIISRRSGVRQVPAFPCREKDTSKSSAPRGSWVTPSPLPPSRRPAVGTGSGAPPWNQMEGVQENRAGDWECLGKALLH